MLKKIDNGEYRLNGIALEILHLMHKGKSIREIKKITGIDEKSLNSAVKSLILNRLAVKVVKNNNFIEKDFGQALGKNLAQALGPMAAVLIEDLFNELDVDKNKILKNQAAAIIRNLADEIKHNDLKISFIKTMTDYLK